MKPNIFYSHVLFIYLFISFTYLFTYFEVASMPSVGLELTTLRYRVACPIDWASQEPLKQNNLKRTTKKKKTSRKEKTSKIKTSLVAFSNKLHIAEERTNEYKDIAMENFQSGGQRTKRQKKKKTKFKNKRKNKIKN